MQKERNFNSCLRNASLHDTTEKLVEESAAAGILHIYIHTYIPNSWRACSTCPEVNP
jgi:hypothetical protein